MPQVSLRDYFAAMRGICGNDLNGMSDSQWFLPFRRFNPAALTTESGRSVIAQLLKACRAIVVEDIDLSPPDLLHHVRQFGLHDVAVVQCTNDGFRTEAYHYIVTRPDMAAHLKGKRLW